MNNSASDVICASGIKFGTSGARAIVEDFTAEVCAAFTVAFLETVREEFEFDKLSIAIDRRPSSTQIASWCSAAAQSFGVDVDYQGILPTPALALHSMQSRQPSIMITGSHIPFDRNGLKFYRPDGEITKADEKSILTSNAEVPEVGFEVDLKKQNQAKSDYIKRYLNLFEPDQLRHKRVGIYEHSMAGRELYKIIFEHLGAEVISLGYSDQFVPIDTEAVSEEDQQRAKKWAFEHQLDLIFSTDGDGDRPLIADETGEWLRGDIVGLLTASFLKIEALAIPVSCNTAIEESQKFERIIRTKIGSPHVIEAMNELDQSFSKVAGFEANGGFLLGSALEINGTRLEALPTRDALLPVFALLGSSIKENQPLSSLVKGLPQRYTASNRLEEFPVDRSKELLSSWSESFEKAPLDLGGRKKVSVLDSTDGLRWVFDDKTVLHIRPSGNAPELRCYVEAGSDFEANQLLQELMAALHEKSDL